MNIILFLLEFKCLLPVHTQSRMSDALNDANEFAGTQTLVQCLTLHQMLHVEALTTLYLGGPEFKSRPADHIF